MTTGLLPDLGSDLQVTAAAFLDAASQLGASYAARRAGQTSTFTRVGSKGGLPPSPDRPLVSSAENPNLAADAGVQVASAGCPD